MEVNQSSFSGLSSNDLAVAQMEVKHYVSDGFSSDDFTVALGKTDMVV